MSDDPEVAEVYAAESDVREVFDLADSSGERRVHLYQTTIVLPEELWFTDQHAVKDFCDRVCDRLYWPRVDVFMKDGANTAHYWLRSIHLPYSAWAYRELVILHELAHHGASHIHGLGLIDGHGREFRQTLLRLVRMYMGPEASLLLTAAYSSRGLQI